MTVDPGALKEAGVEKMFYLESQEMSSQFTNYVYIVKPKSVQNKNFFKNP